MRLCFSWSFSESDDELDETSDSSSEVWELLSSLSNQEAGYSYRRESRKRHESFVSFSFCNCDECILALGDCTNNNSASADEPYLPGFTLISKSRQIV